MTPTGHYEPRERTAQWERTVRAHYAAARLAEHHEGCGCRGLDCPIEAALFSLAYRMTEEAGLEATSMRGRWPIELFRAPAGRRAEFGDSVARWRDSPYVRPERV